MQWRYVGGRIWWAVYQYSGVRFVVLKFTGKPTNDPKFRDAPSGMLWALGIYVATFGLADQQYAKALDTAQLLEQDQIQHDSSDWDDDCVSLVNYLTTGRLGPLKPELFRPSTVFQSLFGGAAPFMDEVFTEARKHENNARFKLWFVVESSGADVGARLEYDSIKNLALRTHIKSDQELFQLYVFLAAAEIEYYAEKSDSIIDLKGVPELYEQCFDTLTTVPHSIDASYHRSFCTAHVFAWGCAEPPKPEEE